MPLDDGYLAYLRAQPRGDATAGEIALLTEPAEIEAANEEMRARLSKAGQPAAWADIGRVYTDKYVSIHRDAVRFCDGSLGTYIRIHVGPELHQVSGIVACVTKARRMLVKRIFRNGTRHWEFEFPRGGRLKEQSVLEAGLDEVREETGYAGLASPPRVLGEFCVDSSLMTSRIAVVHVEVAGARDATLTIAGESIDPAEHWWNAEQLDEAIATGKLRDGFSLSAWSIARGHGLVDGA